MRSHILNALVDYLSGRTVYFLAISIAAVSCGGGSDGTATNGANANEELPAVVTRIEIENQGLLLTNKGQKSRLKARAYNASGEEVALGRIVWNSDNPSSITIDDKGEITALVENGSAQITVTDGGRKSISALAVVAETAPNTTIISSDSLATTPILLQPATHFAVGTKFSVKLSPSAPAVKIGQILVATGANPFIARVARFGTNERDVELDGVSPFDAFPRLNIRSRTMLSVSDLIVSEGVSDIFQITTTTDNEIVVELKPDRTFIFESGRAPLSISRRKVALAIAPSLSCKATSGAEVKLGTLKFKHELKGVQAVAQLTPGGLVAMIDGPFAFELGTESSMHVPAGGKAECELTFGTLPIKLIGPLAWLLGTEVPFGIKVNASPIFGKLTAKLETNIRVGGSIEVGIDCSGPACRYPHEVKEATAKGSLKPTWEGSLLDQVGYKFGAYGFIKVRASPEVDWIKGPKILLTTTRLGLEVEATTSTESIQASNQGTPSHYSAKMTSKISSSDEFEVVDNTKIADIFKYWVKVDLVGYEYNNDFWSKKSPTGEISIPKYPSHPGEAFSVRVSLQPSELDFPFLGYIPDKLYLYLKKKDGVFLDFPIQVIDLKSGSEASMDVVATQDILDGRLYAFWSPKFNLLLGIPAVIGYIDVATSVKPTITTSSCKNVRSSLPDGNVLYTAINGTGTMVGDDNTSFGIFATTDGPTIDPVIGYRAGPKLSLACGVWTPVVDQFGSVVRCERRTGQPERSSWSIYGESPPISSIYYYFMTNRDFVNPGVRVNCDPLEE